MEISRFISNSLTGLLGLYFAWLGVRSAIDAPSVETYVKCVLLYALATPYVVSAIYGLKDARKDIAPN